MTTSQKSPEDRILEEWVGAWALAPQDDRDRRAAELARASIRLTKSGSFTSPVAVASIDILGIKSVLSKMSLVEVAERFAEPFYDLRSPAYGSGNVTLSPEEWEQHGFREAARVYSVSISDTILLMRRPDWELGDRAIAEATAVIDLAKYVCKMIKINSAQGVPLRAAIAFGECLISIGQQHALLGIATGEASAWERQQEWIGGMLTPSAVAALLEGGKEAREKHGSDLPRYPNTLTPYPIPLKAGCPALPEPQIALNWVTGETLGIAWLIAPKVPDEPGDDLPEDVRHKHLNTRAFAKHCEQQPFPFVKL
jgi:hypothetical protein